MVAQDSKPQETAATSLNSSKRRRRPGSKAPTSPSRMELPEDVERFMQPIPSFTLTEAKEQTAPKTGGDFETVFSRLVGDAPVRRVEKKPDSV